MEQETVTTAVSTMQFIHIRYTKHEDNEKDENEEFNLECLFFLCRGRDKILPSRFRYNPSLPNRLTGEWSYYSSCKQKNHCMRFAYLVILSANRFTSPIIAASAQADMRRRYNDRACPRSTGVNSLPRDRPFVFPICLRERSGRVTVKYSSDLYSRCNPCFRYHPTCLRPWYYNERVEKNHFFFFIVINQAT